MKNSLYLTLLIICSVLLSSCDYFLIISGRIVDQNTGKPIAGATITSPEHNRPVFYSDSLGMFRCEGIGSRMFVKELQFLVEADGYESAYVDTLKSRPSGTSDLLISLRPLQAPQTTQAEYYLRGYIKNLWYSNLSALAIILFTLGFVLIKRIPWKYLWAFVIILFNFSFRINQLNGDFELWVLNTQIFAERLFDSSYTMFIILPVPALIFWGYYLMRSRRTLRVRDKD